LSARNPTYPGVYVLELPSDVKTIMGTSTSVTAFIGTVSKGPRNEAVLVHSFAEFSQIFGGLTKNSMLSYMIYHYYLNGGIDAIVVGIDDGSKAAKYSILYHKPLAAEETGGEWAKPETTEEWLKFVSKSPGEWGNNYSVVVEKKKTSNTAGQNKTILNLYVKEAYTGAIPKEQDTDPQKKEKEKQIIDWLKKSSNLESFYNLSLDNNNSRFISKVLQNESLLIQTPTTNDQIIKIPQEDQERTYVFTPYLERGLSGGKATEENVVPVKPEDIESKKGIYALEKINMFNMLVIAPYKADELGNVLDVDKSVRDFAASYCETRRAIYLVDPLFSWKKKGDLLLKDGGVDGTNFGPSRHKNSVLYFPNIRSQDPLDGNRLREFPPSGAMAGVIASTDSARGFWKSPAGIESVLRGVSDLSIKLTDNENGDLNPLGVNCLRIKPPAGIVPWGARTMVGADELVDQWKYLAVRRTALYIEESLYRGTQWIIFEPNDERLWSQIRLNVGAFMHDLYTKGAFQGTSPREAYMVKCDKETTSQHDVDRGIVNILVGFAPLKPAEFVILQIKQLAGNSSAGGGV
jgi:phage tail sheath protein FI